jgi:ribosomal protection tetracycline resistance protein
VLLYGAVQQEVIAQRLNREFNIDVLFEQARPVYVERPSGRGESIHEFKPRGPNDFWQTLGIRIEPMPMGTGNNVTRQVQFGKLPRAYYQAIEDAALGALRQGLYGWKVTDCGVTITHIGYDPPMTNASDFRNLTRLVLMQALKKAGSDVYEPTYSIEVETPDNALSDVIARLVSLQAELGQSRKTEAGWVVPAEIAAKSLHDFAVALPGLTHGEGVVWHEPGRDRRVSGVPPTRERFDFKPAPQR